MDNEYQLASLSLARARSLSLSLTHTLSLSLLHRCDWPETNSVDLFIELFFIFEVLTQTLTGTFTPTGEYVHNFRGV